VERNSEIAQRLKLRIFPCLNPWGLIHNKRSNADGLDLNRCYHDRSTPIVAKHRQLVLQSRYDLALILHEDYTIETASEFHIDSRVEAHVAAIDTAIALLID